MIRNSTDDDTQEIGSLNVKYTEYWTRCGLFSAFWFHFALIPSLFTVY